MSWQLVRNSIPMPCVSHHQHEILIIPYYLGSTIVPYHLIAYYQKQGQF